jgi:hypothetical protein
VVRGSSGGVHVRSRDGGKQMRTPPIEGVFLLTIAVALFGLAVIIGWYGVMALWSDR